MIERAMYILETLADAKSGYYELQISDGDGVYMGEDAVELAEAANAELKPSVATLAEAWALLEWYGEHLASLGLTQAYFGPISGGGASSVVLQEAVLYFWENGKVNDTGSTVFWVEGTG